MSAGPAPGTFVTSARAPGKCIVFGEHSVVHGGPELLFAVDLHTQLLVRTDATTSFNADPLAPTENPYLRTALERLWADGPPLYLRAVSRIPRAAGLGSSAALVACLAVALDRDSGGDGPGKRAQRCFEIERAAQGVGSPGDTSASVAGGYLTLNSDLGEPLWTVQDAERSWDVRRIADPGWVWVVAYSGVPRSTSDAVRAVGRRLEREDGAKILAEFASVARDGIRAIESGDREAVAAAMVRNHRLLRDVGVSHPRLEALIEAVGPAAQGAKLTGAGCGGSIVVLPHPGRETEAMRRLARAGAVPFAVRASSSGAETVPPPSETAFR